MYQKSPGSRKDQSFVLSEIMPDIKGSHSAIVQKLLWFLIMAWVIRLTIFMRGRAGSSWSSVDVVAMIQIAIVFIVLFVSIASQRLPPVWSTISKTSLPWLFLYFIICGISAAWSSEPQYSFYRALEALSLLTGVLIALSYSPNFLRAERAILIVALITVVATMYTNGMRSGWSTNLRAWHTNSYSASAAVLFCYCLGEYFSSEGKRKKRLRRFGVAGLAALILGTSSGSFIATLVGVSVIAFLRRNMALIVTAVS